MEGHTAICNQPSEHSCVECRPCYLHMQQDMQVSDNVEIARSPLHSGLNLARLELMHLIACAAQIPNLCDLTCEMGHFSLTPCNSTDAVS